jgi:hypothetical protein
LVRAIVVVVAAMRKEQGCVVRQRVPGAGRQQGATEGGAGGGGACGVRSLGVSVSKTACAAGRRPVHAQKREAAGSIDAASGLRDRRTVRGGAAAPCARRAARGAAAQSASAVRRSGARMDGHVRRCVAPAAEAHVVTPRSKRPPAAPRGCARLSARRRARHDRVRARVAGSDLQRRTTTEDGRTPEMTDTQTDA